MVIKFTNKTLFSIILIHKLYLTWNIQYPYDYGIDSQRLDFVNDLNASFSGTGVTSSSHGNAHTTNPNAANLQAMQYG